MADKPCILVIEAHEGWRQVAYAALKEATTLNILATYDKGKIGQVVGRHELNLIVLGCYELGEDERKLLAYLISTGISVLVVMSTINLESMREIFHLGATDVATNKPFGSPGILAEVEKALSHSPR